MARFIVLGRGPFRRRSERRTVRRPLRPSTRRSLRSLFVAVTLSLAASVGVAGGSSATPNHPVSLGEVSGKTPAGEFATPLRCAVREALDAANLGRPRERFVLSASLETLDAKKDGRRVSATAVVSMVLRREKEQTLHAILRGNATAEASDVTLDSAREDALRAAVESAMRRLPEALMLPRRR